MVGLGHVVGQEGGPFLPGPVRAPVMLSLCRPVPEHKLATCTHLPWGPAFNTEKNQRNQLIRNPPPTPPRAAGPPFLSLLLPSLGCHRVMSSLLCPLCGLLPQCAIFLCLPMGLGWFSGRSGQGEGEAGAGVRPGGAEFGESLLRKRRAGPASALQ